MSRFHRIQLEVEALVRARGTMDAAVELIYAAEGLDEEEQSALWLLAWSLLPEKHHERSHAIATERMRHLVLPAW